MHTNFETYKKVSKTFVRNSFHQFCHHKLSVSCKLGSGDFKKLQVSSTKINSLLVKLLYWVSNVISNVVLTSEVMCSSYHKDEPVLCEIWNRKSHNEWTEGDGLYAVRLRPAVHVQRQRTPRCGDTQSHIESH